MRDRIRERNWGDLFAAGGCYFFALLLHEELQLPLFYMSPPNCNEFSHVFVMRGCECIDYVGKRPVEEIAKLYAGWPDEMPRPTCPSEISSKIKEKGYEEELAEEIYQIAKREFARRKQMYLSLLSGY